MAREARIIFIPGEVSIDIYEAVKKAFRKIRPAGLVRAGGQYIGRSREALSNLAPAVHFPRPRMKALNTPVRPLTFESKENKARRVRRELIDAGTTFYGLLKSESRILPDILHNNEHLQAVVYGQHHSSSVMLAATNERILFIDKKPMAVFVDEVTYEVVSGLELEIHTLFATVVLHTPVKNYDLRFVNLHCAENFARHIEARRIKSEMEEKNAAEPADLLETLLEKSSDRQKLHEQEDLAGYYWLPTKDEDEERRLPPPAA